MMQNYGRKCDLHIKYHEIGDGLATFDLESDDFINKDDLLSVLKQIVAELEKDLS
jgi:hypothetical protein